MTASQICGPLPENEMVGQEATISLEVHHGY